jgi:hypothetical protein
LGDDDDLGKTPFRICGLFAYFDHLEKLMMAAPTQYRQFMMVSTDTDEPGVSDFYVGVPNEAFMAWFDGFERVEESQVPKVIDTLHIGDANEIERRFQFRHRLRERA